MNQRKLTFLGVLYSAVGLALVRVWLFWNFLPWAGDFPQYVQWCGRLQSTEQPLIPTFMYLVGFFVNSPVLETLAFSVVGYVLVFLTVYLCALELTDNVYASAVGYCCFVVTMLEFVTPTAIKNIWALFFMLASIYMLHKYLSVHSRKNLLFLSVGVLLTALAHSLPIFPLLLILSINAIASFKNDRTLFYVGFVGAISGFVTLFAVNKLIKFNGVVCIFLSNPATNIMLNLSYYTQDSMHHLAVVLFAGTFALACMMFKKWNATYIGLVASCFVMLFIGNVDYAERLIENCVPLNALAVSCVVKFANGNRGHET